MSRYVVRITGACPKTEAELLLELVAAFEEDGNIAAAIDQQNRIAALYDTKARTEHFLKTGNQWPDPDELVAPLASPEHPLWWHVHSAQEARQTSCRCGHFADFLCDRPLGRGRTCDAPLCLCCRQTAGDGVDFCPAGSACELSARIAAS